MDRDNYFENAIKTSMTPTLTPTLTVELVTPDKARDYLRQQSTNRKPDPLRIKKYGDRMASGEWHLGSALEFNEEGKLFNGQHRLFAVVRSGCTVPFLVVRGVRG